MQELRARALDLPFTHLEWKFFAVIIAIHLALDVATMWVEHWFVVLAPGAAIPTNWIEAFSLACLFSQIVILGIWAALFPGSNLLRVLLATLILCICAYVLTWLAQLIAPAVTDFRAWAKLTGLPFVVVVFYTVQILFWILRFTFGWRIVLNAPSVKTERHRYTVLHILGWMAFLSVLLGLGQVYHGRRAAEAPLIIGCLALLSWLYGVPYLWVTLRAKRLLLALAVCIPLSAAVTLVGWRFYLLFYPSAPSRALQAFMFVQCGAALAGLGTGIAARLFGYRLITHARDQKSE